MVQDSPVFKLFQALEIQRTKRNLGRPWKIVFQTAAVLYSLFLISTALSGEIPSSMVRGIFMALVSGMVFLLYPFSKKSPGHRPSAVDFILTAMAFGAFGNFALHFDEMALRAGEPVWSDLFFGSMAILIVCEVCRRCMSYSLPLLAICALFYAHSGSIFPKLLAHPGLSLSIIIADTYSSLNGIFGIVAYVFATYVVLFIIMAAFFEKSGAGRFFMDLPIALSARLRGGPAKAVVFSSTLFGMISGSATANTVATGAFTIPLMKKTGYKPEVAGAIEPAVDVGGMFMPPVMGAGAFIMAEMMGIPYGKVALIALVPALIYFTSTLVMVHFEALRTGIGTIPPGERQPAAPIFYQNWYYGIPLAILFYLILSGRSPQMGAFYAILSAAAICLAKNIVQRNPRRTVGQIFDGLVAGGEQSLSMAATAGPVGVIIGMALLTGLAFKFSALVLSYTYGLKWMALILVLLATFVLGMGMTVTSDYLMLAIIAVPSMVVMGIPPLAAHFVCFWYSQSANITPPVCLSVFAGAGIAGTHPYPTALHAMRFSAYMYIMPFMFVYSPILMPDGFSLGVLMTWVTGFLSCIPFAAGMTGYLFGRLDWPPRLVLILASILLIIPGVITDGLGLFLWGAIGISQFLKGRRVAAQPF